jgi:hypothetical protein
MSITLRASHTGDYSEGIFIAAGPTPTDATNGLAMDGRNAG